jgi:hypothetical protein
MKRVKFTVIIIALLAFNFSNAQTKDDKKIKSLFDDNKVKNIDIVIPHKSYAANAYMRVGIIINTTKNKKIELSEKDCLKHFNISITGAIIDTLGIIRITNIKYLLKHSIVISAASKYNKSYTDTDTINIDFKDTLKLSYNGATGETGENGKFGENGEKKGNSASSGQNGQNGKVGKDGSPGQSIEISVSLLFDSILDKNLLNVNIKNIKTLAIENYLMDTNGYASISVNGGNGGIGGRGGDGGNGVNGVCRAGIIGHGTYAGNGGHGGDGGLGGLGGYISIVFDSLCSNYINHFILINEGGIGGKGGLSGDPGNPGQNYYNGNPDITTVSMNKYDPGSKGNDGSKGPAPTIKIENLIKSK